MVLISYVRSIEIRRIRRCNKLGRGGSIIYSPKSKPCPNCLFFPFVFATRFIPCTYYGLETNNYLLTNRVSTRYP